jgi:arylsulfatase A-like enzyme
MMRRGMTMALAGASALAALAAHAGEAPRPRLPPASNIIIAVFDACRPDKMGAYGFERQTTPRLDALARDPDALVFRAHHVQAPATKSSTASLFTGRYPFEHGIVTQYRAGKQPENPLVTVHALDERFETLAERLRALGYATFAVVKSFHLAVEYGFAQGFDVYVSANDAPSDVGRVRRFVELAAGARRPFFGYLHVNACHHPFPEPERDAAYMAQHALPYDEAARRAAGVDFTTSEVLWRIRDGSVRLDAADVRFLQLLYEAKLRATDERLARPLIEGLRGAGRYDDTLLIVTADHGEELYEHGGYAHGHALWQEVIHVPLIVKFPRGARPAGVERATALPTQAIDLVPTLLGLLGAPPADLPGRSLLVADAAPRLVYAETAGLDGREIVRSLRRGGDKLIETRGGIALFDLAADPGERRDLAPARPQRSAALRDELRRLTGAVPAAPAPTVARELPPEVRERLRSLGYGPADD